MSAGNGDCSIAVLRGGSWVDQPEYLRSADRDSVRRDYRNVNIGLRVVRTLRER